MSGKTCGARFYPANGETVTPCELPVGHADEQHRGWCLGSPCRWSGGEVEHEEYVSGWEDADDPAPPFDVPRSVCGNPCAVPCSEECAGR